MNTVDCTPTWKAAVTIYLAVIEQEASNSRFHSTAMINARDGLYELAGHMDRINEENRKVKDANKAEIETGRVISTNGNFNISAMPDFGHYRVFMVADGYMVGSFNAVTNEFKFNDEVSFTVSALQELIATGNCMHQFYSK